MPIKPNNIGRGKTMSIAKAAVIEFNEGKCGSFVYSGDIDFFHRVIDRRARSMSGQQPCTKFSRASGHPSFGNSKARSPDGAANEQTPTSQHETNPRRQTPRCEFPSAADAGPMSGAARHSSNPMPTLSQPYPNPMPTQ
jgi:hypothetical protein